jgi:hypothetical protein
MAYNRDEIYQQAQAAIRDHNLFFIEDVVAFLPICRATFYNLFDEDLDKLDTLKKMLEANKIRTKASIRNKLYKGKGGDLIALYKMICTEDERRALSMSYIDARHEMPNHNGQLLLHPKKED